MKGAISLGRYNVNPLRTIWIKKYCSEIILSSERAVVERENMNFESIEFASDLYRDLYMYII